jgi:hypothetical protein
VVLLHKLQLFLGFFKVNSATPKQYSKESHNQVDVLLHNRVFILDGLCHSVDIKSVKCEDDNPNQNNMRKSESYSKHDAEVDQDKTVVTVIFMAFSLVSLV